MLACVTAQPIMHRSCLQECFAFAVPSWSRGWALQGDFDRVAGQRATASNRLKSHEAIEEPPSAISFWTPSTKTGEDQRSFRRFAPDISGGADWVARLNDVPLSAAVFVALITENSFAASTATTITTAITTTALTTTLPPWIATR